MNRSLFILAVALVACVAGSVPSNFAEDNEDFYESPTSNVEMRVIPDKRSSSRGLDPMAGVTFGSIKKRIDSLSGESFGAQKRSDDTKLRSYLGKNLDEQDIMTQLNINSHSGFDRDFHPELHLSAREQQSQNAFLFPKKYPLPYYLSYANIPVYYHTKNKGM